MGTAWLRRRVFAACAIAMCAVAVAAPLAATPAAHTVAAVDAVSSTGTEAIPKKPYELYRHDHPSMPMQWLACRAIGYRINTAHMPAGMDAVVKSVMKSVGGQVGVTFSYLGTTKRTFGSTAHSTTTPTIYVSFTASKHAGGQTFGWPGTIGVGGPGGGWLTSADGEFDAILYGDVLLYTGFHAPKTGAGVTWSSLIRHEIGHTLDLAHRASKTAVMYPDLTASAPSKFSTAEVTALKKVFQTSSCDYTSFGEIG